MKKILLPLLSLILLASCNKKEHFTLCGTFENGAGQMLYLEELTPDGLLFIDSIRLDKKGSFTYKYAMPYESFYNLHSSESDFLMLLPQNGERITLSGDYRQLQWSYEVDGSPESQLLWELQQYTNMCIATANQITVDYRESSAGLTGKDSVEAREAFRESCTEVREELGEYLTHFIIKNRGSLSTIIALYKPFGGDEPVIAPRYNMEMYEEVLAGLEEMRPTNPHTKYFSIGVAKLRYESTH